MFTRKTPEIYDFRGSNIGDRRRDNFRPSFGPRRHGRSNVPPGPSVFDNSGPWNNDSSDVVPNVTTTTTEPKTDMSEKPWEEPWNFGPPGQNWGKIGPCPDVSYYFPTSSNAQITPKPMSFASYPRQQRPGGSWQAVWGNHANGVESPLYVNPNQIRSKSCYFSVDQPPQNTGYWRNKNYNFPDQKYTGRESYGRYSECRGVYENSMEPIWSENEKLSMNHSSNNNLNVQIYPWFSGERSPYSN